MHAQILDASCVVQYSYISQHHKTLIVRTCTLYNVAHTLSYSSALDPIRPRAGACVGVSALEVEWV